MSRADAAHPQTFKAAAAAALEDPTAGCECDFCLWRDYTAADGFGRVENEHAVTASNLFKITGHHGLVLFKHHAPLEFTAPQLGGLLSAAQGWVHAAHAATPAAAHPLLLWNALPRSGASQFHGHAQVVMSEAGPLPDVARRDAAAASYSAAHPARAGRYAADLAAGHAALGLHRALGLDGELAVCYASVAPLKDCEVTVHGASAASPAFVLLLHLALRTLLDRCGVVSFNAAVEGLSLAPADSAPASACADADALCAAPGGVTARLLSRGKAASKASDFGALEVFGGASIGHTSPWTLMAALDDEAAARGVAWTS